MGVISGNWGNGGDGINAIKTYNDIIQPGIGGTGGNGGMVVMVEGPFTVAYLRMYL